ncbi:MFS transporter [Candidatus Woesearchaeota archaeon]|nr:MFS transporter [Candidatus Woesearchaeota archaeon]
MTPKKRFYIPEQSRLLLKASLIASFGVGLFAPIYAIFVERIGGDLLDVGLAYAIYCFIAGLVIIILGTSKLFQKNLRFFVVSGFALMGLCYFAYMFIQTPFHLFYVQVMLGLSNGVLEPAWDALFSSKVSEKQASKNWSMWSGGVSIATGASAFIGAYIASFSFDTLFLSISLLCLVSAILSTRLLVRPSSA